MEYTSSPVAQPGIQTRTVRRRAPALEQLGHDHRASASNASVSRKKLVTLISRSRNSGCASAGSCAAAST